MDKLGFTSVTFRSKSTEEIISLAEKYGVQYIEWGADKHVVPGDYKTALEVRNKCDAVGIKTLSYGSYFRIGESDISEYKAICKTADILGAETVRVWLGTRSSLQTDADGYDRLAEQTAKACDISAEYGIITAFEFHKNTFNDSAGNAAKLVRECNKNNAQTYWQPFSRNYDEDMKNLKSTLSLLNTVHVFNWDRNEVRYPLSKGEKKWKSFIDTIPFDCRYIMEFVKNDDEKQFCDDLSVIKSLLNC